MIRHLLLSFVLLFSAPVLFAQSVGVDHPEVKALLAATKAMRTVQADFTQEKHLKVLKEPVIEPGSFAFERPDRFRWSTNGAAPMVILTNGEKVRVKEGTKEKILNPGEQRMYAAINGMVLDILSGKMLESPDMKPTYELVEDAVHVRLTPTQSPMAKRVKSFTLTFDRTTHLLRTMETAEHDGDRTLVRYAKVVADKALPSGTFTDL
ncbi:MAG: outer membrane lipoprotein carrier protein LolA [Flavobacteriales bacterium]|jgi:outer membrane lipoprotein carrier protein|nr:outer membrane lipoprotein carrier protein LolA [Flavobacteriales bacterium]MBK9540531.1 outer membrane lipoprotein carrier protein LolA [Flavobacteriales bacterium]